MRSLQADALELSEALTAMGDTGDCQANGPPGTMEKCSDELVAQQTQRGPVIIFVFEEAAGRPGTLFEVKNVEKIKSIEDKIMTQKDYSKYCLKPEHADEDYDTTPCSDPLSVVNIFYSSVDPTAITDEFITGVLPAFESTVTELSLCIADSGLAKALGGAGAGGGSPMGGSGGMPTTASIGGLIGVFAAFCAPNMTASPIPGINITDVKQVPTCAAACTAVNSAVGQYGVPAMVEAATFPTKVVDRAFDGELTQERVDTWLGMVREAEAFELHFVSR